MKTLLIRFAIAVIVCATSSVSFGLDDIKLPPGFAIEEFASVPNARTMIRGDKGTIFVSTRAQSVYAVVADGEGTKTITLLEDLKSPNGVAFHDGDLYVAEIDRVTRYADIEARLLDVPEGEVLAIDLPSERHHGWRYIAFGPDGLLYISIGVPCNVCDDVGYGQIVRMHADGSGRETYAEGVRNSVGLTWHPDTGDLWFTDNGRDMLGDDLPPDELNRASETGQHFGFPYCHAGFLPDPKFGAGKDCAAYRAPARKLGPHVAPLGLTFYTGAMFPPQYHGQIFIAEHGSWNRSKKIGYRVMTVGLQDGVAVSYEPFASGWLQGESVSGRPVDLLVLADGSMLVSDDHAGKIYRISYADSGKEER